ncbi:hypothetical protein AWZ03_013168 [Drosophila navojoa]|uniref:SprT-like domain-containing protein n=1 Tax=Drosophila navojoa TaxID=7232 RepID=A0A484AUX1_DRONA|nr:hypothetical protein AWZ03_013168 [Drosophila navojoa]
MNLSLELSRDKPKIPATPVTTPSSSNPTRRQLFTPSTGYEDNSEAIKIVNQAIDLNSLEQLELIYLPGTNVHKRIQEVKKQFGMGVAKRKAKPVIQKRTPKCTAPPIRARQEKMALNEPCSFFKSLEPGIPPEFCESTAYFYRENYMKVKECLAKMLYILYNKQVFHNKLDVEITWSPRLQCTAGHCKNKADRNGVRSSRIELSDKVLTSADRLRSILIHELCHAAAWIFNGADGHGVAWRAWAARANEKFPDLPPITVCHKYKIFYKYTYKCRSCRATTHAHSKSRKRTGLICRLCKKKIKIFLNRKTKRGVRQTPVRPPLGFAKYFQDNYHKCRRNAVGGNVMRILAVEYAKEKALAEQSPITKYINKYLKFFFR